LPQIAGGQEVLARSGPIKTYEAPSESGSTLGFLSCADCGSPLRKTTTPAPDLDFVSPSTLDDPSICEPGRNVFEASRLP